MEAKFISCYEETSHGIWTKEFHLLLRIVDSISKTLRINCDISAVVFLGMNNKSRVEVNTLTEST